MNTTTLTATAAAQLARLNGSHGYRLEGDTVHLNAMFALLHPEAHNRNWLLQLWACPTAPISARDIAGHKIAEISLPPMGELSDESEHFGVSAFACPPAGAGDYAMVLVLVSARNGRPDEIQDFAVYANRENFNLPRLAGNVSYRVDGSRVEIAVNRVENPRPADNLSGSLSLELWALTEPYSGARFEGHHLAGVEIGLLAGQNSWDLAPYDLEFRAPPVGHWNIVLMLREWTLHGFVTRDFVNFPIRYTVAAAPALVTKAAPIVDKPAAAVVAAPVVAKAPAPVATHAAPPVIAKTPAAVVAPAPVVVPPSAPVVPPSLGAVKPVAPAAPAASVAAKAPAPAPVKAAAPAVAAAPKGVSINSAKVEELAGVKGLTKKLAETIVKNRPYNSVEDLRHLKGIGAAGLEKIRASLRL